MDKRKTYRFSLPEDHKFVAHEEIDGVGQRVVHRTELEEPIECGPRDVVEVVTTYRTEGGPEVEARKLGLAAREWHHFKNWLADLEFSGRFETWIWTAKKFLWLVRFAIHMKHRARCSWAWAWGEAEASIEMLGAGWPEECAKYSADEAMSYWEE